MTSFPYHSSSFKSWPHNLWKSSIFFLFLISFISYGNSSLHPIKDYPPCNIKYDECREVIPNFEYRIESYPFVNNSLITLLSPDPKDQRILSERCRNYLINEYPKREQLRRMKRCEFLHLPHLCPSTPPSNDDIFKLQKLTKKVGLHIVILFLLSHKPAAALASVEHILNSNLYFNSTIRFIFHLDSSSTPEMWNDLTKFSARYPDNTYLIPKDQAIDVEWGDISTAQAIYLSMTISRRVWANQLSTFVVLSETSLVVAPLTSIYLFFHRYHGMSYPGSKPSVVPSTDSTWKLSLNDVSIVCDRRIFHLGWRDHPISNEDGYFHGAHLFSFWSFAFIDWLIDTEEGRNAYQALVQRLSQTVTSDEFFWGTLFYNSPFCHTLANIFDYRKGIGQELSAHVWSQDCDSSDNWGKEACQSMVHQPLGWWSGNSPEWITFGDIPQLIARQPLFVRKVKSDVNECKELLKILDSVQNEVYNTLTTISQQRKVIFSLLSTSQQATFSSLVSSPLTLSLKSDRKYYKKYRTISSTDLMLSLDPDLNDEVAQELSLELEDLVRTLPNEPRYYLTTIEKKKGRGKGEKECVRIKKSDGSLEWVRCNSLESDPDLKPTPFVLRNCIGNVTLHHELDDKKDETCQNVSSSSLLMSSSLPSGHMFGHCSLVSVGNIRTLSGIPFCLSPALVKFNKNYNSGPSPISYNDIHGQRISGSGIGFLPCDVDYSVGYAEQLFIFQKDASIEYGTRFSRSKDFIKEKMSSGTIAELVQGRVDGKTRTDPSLCLIKRNENQLGLLSCTEAKKKEKLTLMLVR